MNKPGLAIKNAGCATASYAFMALSPLNPKSRQYADLFSAGMRKIHKSGQLKKILAAYGVPEWPLPASP